MSTPAPAPSSPAAVPTPTAAGSPALSPLAPNLSLFEEDLSMAKQDFGPTEPLLNQEPTEDELKQNLMFEQQIQATVESPADGEARVSVLVRIERLIQTWMGKLLRAKGYQNPENHGGRLFTFGSYKLGVHFPGADIDTLCVAPKDVDREDFFTSLVKILRRHGLVSELNPVRDAHVPVIKMKFSNVQIDLVFSALDLDWIPPPPEFSIGADSLLRNLDDASQRSINGARVAEKLLHCVPSVDNFRLALRGIKLWAKNRGVYGNIFGFPGGVAWAIMTARICQLYPLSPPSVIITGFFRFYSSFIKADVPANQPIYLTKTLEVTNEYGKKSWNKKNEQFELMPVITPMCPYMNSCYNVGRSNLQILCCEFKRGKEIVDELEDDHNECWSKLWIPSDFFLKYKVFLQVEVSAMDSSSFNSWSAYVESKLRHLVSSLETWPSFSEVHEVAKTSYQLDIRLWPFLFCSTTPTERLHFNRTDSSDIPPAIELECVTPSTTQQSTKEGEPSTNTEGRVENTEELITGYYFIGLDTCEPRVSKGESRQIVDFGGAVEQFHQSLYSYGKTDKMIHPVITLVKRRNIPPWVLSQHEKDELRKRDQALAARRAMRGERPQREVEVSSQDPVPEETTTSENPDAEMQEGDTTGGS